MYSGYKNMFPLWKQCWRNLKIAIVHLIGFNKATQGNQESTFPRLPGSFCLSGCLFLSFSIALPLSFMHSDKCFSGAWATVWTKWDGLLCGFWQGETAANSLIRNLGSEGRETLSCESESENWAHWAQQNAGRVCVCVCVCVYKIG